MIGLLEGSRRTKGKTTEKVLLLHATLLGCQPRIWRRFAAREAMWLSALHDVIQVAFDWYDYQTHSFQFEEQRYGNPLQRDELLIADDRDVTLSDVDAASRKHFLYRYHFGEGWMVELRVEKLLPIEKGARYPKCLAGERAGPPEDCGGVQPFHDMLHALQETGTDMQRKWREWVGPDYDPAVCDVARINKGIRKLGH